VYQRAGGASFCFIPPTACRRGRPRNCVRRVNSRSRSSGPCNLTRVSQRKNSMFSSIVRSPYRLNFWERYLSALSPLRLFCASKSRTRMDPDWGADPASIAYTRGFYPPRPAPPARTFSLPHFQREVVDCYHPVECLAQIGSQSHSHFHSPSSDPYSMEIGVCRHTRLRTPRVLSTSSLTPRQARPVLFGLTPIDRGAQRMPEGRGGSNRRHSILGTCRVRPRLAQRLQTSRLAATKVIPAPQRPQPGRRSGRHAVGEMGNHPEGDGTGRDHPRDLKRSEQIARDRLALINRINGRGITLQPSKPSSSFLQGARRLETRVRHSSDCDKSIRRGDRAPITDPHERNCWGCGERWR